MSSAGVWPSLSDTPLDFTYIPSAMGQGPPLALGLALAQPERGVIVVNGDGCMLMNLGSLVTLAHHPAGVYLLILDNGLYEVTGGQLTAGAGHTDFAGLARAAGIQRVYTFESADSLARALPRRWRDRGRWWCGSRSRAAEAKRRRKHRGRWPNRSNGCVVLWNWPPRRN